MTCENIYCPACEMCHCDACIARRVAVLEREEEVWDESPDHPMTGEKLRLVADWLDLADKAFVRLATLRGDIYEPGDKVQRDLRRWADELDSRGE